MSFCRSRLLFPAIIDSFHWFRSADIVILCPLYMAGRRERSRLTSHSPQINEARYSLDALTYSRNTRARCRGTSYARTTCFVMNKELIRICTTTRRPSIRAFLGCLPYEALQLLLSGFDFLLLLRLYRFINRRLLQKRFLQHP